MTIAAPFVIQPGMRSHGIDGRVRIAITDQTPSLNVVAWVLADFADRVLLALNSPSEMPLVFGSGENSASQTTSQLKNATPEGGAK